MGNIFKDSAYFAVRDRFSGFLQSHKSDIAVLYMAIPHTDEPIVQGRDAILQGSAAEVLSLLYIAIEELADSLEESPGAVIGMLATAVAERGGRLKDDG